MKYQLSTILALVVFVAFSVTVSMADLNEGLVAYWPMDEASGDTAQDETGNGHDGTLLGTPTWETGDVKIGKACINFDGEDDLVEIEPFDVVNGGITLAAWIKPDDFDINDARIISKANEWGGNDHWWMLSTINGPDLRFRFKSEGKDTETLIADAAELVVGEWTHVVGTWDGNTMRLYQNGAEVGNVDYPGDAVATDDSVKVAIGSQPSDAFAADPNHVKKYFDGLIDDVVVYNRALSLDEIQQLASGASIVVAAVEPVGKLTITWGALKQ